MVLYCGNGYIIRAWRFVIPHGSRMAIIWERGSILFLFLLLIFDTPLGRVCCVPNLVKDFLKVY